MQDVGSKEDTELRGGLNPQLARVVCRIPWTLSVCWKIGLQLWVIESTGAEEICARRLWLSGLAA
jgi:hypothetical protein